MTLRPLDISRLRAETPSCQDRVHLDNAGASPSPRAVLDAVHGYLDLEAEIGGYAAHDRMAAELDGFYASAARLLECAPGEVAFTDSATRAWSLAFAAIRVGPGDRILTSVADYASNFLAYIQAERRHGVRVDVVPNDETGQLDVAALARLMDDRVRLVSISHAPSQSGLLNPTAEVGAIVRQSRALYLLDACQSVGQIPTRVPALGCHILSATGRKFLRGPRGTGFLYVEGGVLDQLDPPLIDLHAATWTGEREFRWREGATRFETWEQPFAGKLGLKAAIDYALDVGLEAIAARTGALASRLRDRLTALPGVQVTDPGRRRSAIVTLAAARWSAGGLVRALERRAITSSAISTDTGRLDFEARGLTSVLRVAPHYFNTEGEIDAFCEALTETLATCEPAR